MLNRFFGPATHSNLHLLGLSVLAIGIPANKVVMSVSMMFLILNLLIEGHYKKYYSHLRSNQLFILIGAFYLLHIVALLWSDDLTYGLNDLRVKLPLLVIPLAVMAKPLHKRHLHILLYVFTGSVLLTSLINFGAYVQLFGEREYDDIRGMSLFTSHTRYGLLIATAAAFTLYFAFRNRTRFYFFIPLFLWFVFYTYYSQILSGMIAFCAVLFVFLIYILVRWNRWIAIGSASVLSFIVVFLTIKLFSPLEFDPNDFRNLPEYTAEGNKYHHSFNTISPETGKPIEIYLCEKELEREWQKVSEVPYSGTDMKGQPIRWTLMRYMSSMDLNKDAAGFAELTLQDIHNIEQGYASVYTSGFLSRYYGIKYQLNNTKDPNEHSQLKRFEYWKTGIQIARENLLIGVGTGDVQREFNKQYERNRSILTEENRRRTHNNFLTVLITFGIPGLFLFFWFHAEFLMQNIRDRFLPGLAFISIVLLSYLFEDTLETQTGITFVAYFLALFYQGSRQIVVESTT